MAGKKKLRKKIVTAEQQKGKKAQIKVIKKNIKQLSGRKRNHKNELHQ